MISPGRFAEGVDQLVDVIVAEIAGPEVDEAVARIAVVEVGMEVDWRDGEDEVLDLLGVPRRVDRREGPALADAEQGNRLHAGRSPDVLDAVVQEPVDIGIDGQELIGPRRVPPVDDPEVDAAHEQVPDERAVFLQVGHRVATDQPIDDQHRPGADLDARQRLVVVQRHFLDPHRLRLRGGAYVDVGVADSAESLRAAGEPRPELHGVAPSLVWTLAGTCERLSG